MPPEDDDAPTDYRPTELGAAIDDTEAHRAWALANEPDELPRHVTPQRITALAVAGSLVLIGVAAGVSLWHLRSAACAAVGRAHAGLGFEHPHADSHGVNPTGGTVDRVGASAAHGGPIPN